ncbi:hypothetical protein ACGFZQ_25595 [Streptomyces sp. NPDC048254]|uniref:hypothetical protein n=1 Tax=Streptomyces sp. NPDC048254 TaxID=3365525 RepID=UPI00371FD945
MNATHRLVRLVRRPAGLPTADDFTLARVPVPRPEAGQVLVRNTHFLVFPGLRTLIGGETGDVPLPPLCPGDTLFGPAIGEVVDGPLEKGRLVLHLQGRRGTRHCRCRVQAAGGHAARPGGCRPLPAAAFPCLNPSADLPTVGLSLVVPRLGGRAVGDRRHVRLRRLTPAASRSAPVAAVRATRRAPSVP